MHTDKLIKEIIMSAFYSSLSLNCVTSSLYTVKYIYSNGMAKRIVRTWLYAELEHRRV